MMREEQIVMRTILAVSFFFVTNLLACAELMHEDSRRPAGADKPSRDPELREINFEDVRPIVATSCGQADCHDGVQMFALREREDFFKRKPRPLNAIMRGSMPKGDSGFRETTEGQLLIQWLQTNQEQ
jgi:hypothetical protein